MRLRNKHKLVVAIAQVAAIAIVFFLINGLAALLLYLVSEISLAEVSDFLVGLWSGEGLAWIGYHFFHKAKSRLWHYLNDENDSEIVSEWKIRELKKLLRRRKG